MKHSAEEGQKAQVKWPEKELTQLAVEDNVATLEPSHAKDACSRGPELRARVILAGLRFYCHPEKKL